MTMWQSTGRTTRQVARPLLHNLELHHIRGAAVRMTSLKHQHPRLSSQLSRYAGGELEFAHEGCAHRSIIHEQHDALFERDSAKSQLKLSATCLDLPFRQPRD